MVWSELYPGGRQPSANEVAEYVANPLWQDLTSHLHQAYTVRPQLFYSGCTMQQGAWQGWNIKYKKSGRILCTLYPKQGYFVALIPIGEKERAEAELLLPLCDGYTQRVYRQTKTGAMGKSLGLAVTSSAILQDVKNLLALRATPRLREAF